MKKCPSRGAVDSCAPVPSLTFVNQEINRIPKSSRIGMDRLGLLSDLKQELHLAFYEGISKGLDTPTIKRAIHAAGERLRYREIVRRSKFEVPETLAGPTYWKLMYGVDPKNERNDK